MEYSFNLHLKEDVKKEKPNEIVEARLQYEKVYLEKKREIMGKKASYLKPQIDKHNKKVMAYFEEQLEEAVKLAKNKGNSFTTEEYLRLVKDFWDRLYLFD